MASFDVPVVVVVYAADQGVEVLERLHFGAAILALLMKEVSSKVHTYGP